MERKFYGGGWSKTHRLKRGRVGADLAPSSNIIFAPCHIPLMDKVLTKCHGVNQRIQRCHFLLTLNICASVLDWQLKLVSFVKSWNTILCAQVTTTIRKIRVFKKIQHHFITSFYSYFLSWSKLEMVKFLTLTWSVQRSTQTFAKSRGSIL